VLDLVASIITVQPNATGLKEILDRVLNFLKSPLLQGNALTSVVRLFPVLLQTKGSGLSYSQLVDMLLSVVTPGLALASSMVVAQCVAAMAKSVQASEGQATVERFMKRVSDAKEDHVRQISLLVLGELGRDRDLSEHKDIEDVLFQAFSSESDAVKSAAAFSLGNVAVGNMKKYLPHLLTLVKQHADRRYLLLSSVKEIITRHSGAVTTIATFKPYVDSVLPILFENAESKDEGVRSMVAECLGGLAIIDSKKLIPQMAQLAGTDKPFTRAVVITALRFALAPNTDHVLLRESLGAFLNLLKDENLTVRRQVMLTVNALAHANIDLLSPATLKELILPILYVEIEPNEKYIRVLDLGPFKHKVDDGLPLRKAAFQCLETLLDVAPHRLDLSEYVRKIQLGLVDHDDIEILTYQILANMAQYHGGKLLEVLEELPNQIMKGVKNKLKEAKGNEPERAKDVLRSAVRSMYTINQIPGVEQCVQFTDFYLRVLKTALLAQMLKEMQGT